MLDYTINITISVTKTTNTRNKTLTLSITTTTTTYIPFTITITIYYSIYLTLPYYTKVSTGRWMPGKLATEMSAAANQRCPGFDSCV